MEYTSKFEIREVTRFQVIEIQTFEDDHIEEEIYAEGHTLKEAEKLKAFRIRQLEWFDEDAKRGQ